MKLRTTVACCGALLGVLFSSAALAAGALPAAGAAPNALPALAAPAASPSGSFPAMPSSSSAPTFDSSSSARDSGTLPGLDGTNIRPIRGPGDIPLPVDLPLHVFGSPNPNTKAERRS